MKKNFFILSALAAVATYGFVIDGIAAKVDSDTITIGEVMAEVRHNPTVRDEFAAAARDRVRLERLYRRAVEELVDRRLILKAAADKKMDMQEWVVDNRVREIVKDSFHGDRNLLEAELQKMKTPFEEWRNTIRESLIITAMRFQMIEKYIQPTPGDMRREYDEHRSRYVKEALVTVSVILLKPAAEGQPSVKERANAILAKLAAPDTDFAALAREYSSDSHAKDGGVWKDIKPEDAFRAEIADEIAKLKIGEHSRLVDLDGWGFIVRKDSESAAKKLSFSEAYDDIVRNLRHEEGKAAYEQWLARLRAESFIKIYPMPEK